MKIQEKARVLFNKKMSQEVCKIGLKCDQVFAGALPGQFVTLRLPDHISPLIRRPFSIHGLIEENGGFNGIEILLKVVGEYTKKFFELSKGDIVDLLGPLGNGFSVSKSCQHIFIVSGGIGVAPLAFLASYLRRKDLDIPTCNVFIGGKSKVELLCVDDFADLEMNVSVATDDGSIGYKGMVTGLVKSALKNNLPDLIYACGPMPMLNTMAEIAKVQNIPCQVSIEYIMACGTGACLGCAIESKDPSDKYLHVCTDGPVFDANSIMQVLNPKRDL